MNFLPEEKLFAGHFPGRPILPGVSQIALVAAAMQQGKPGAALSAIPRVRLRQLVAPGERLDLSVRPFGDELLRFELRRDDQVVANGELAFGGAFPSWDSEPPTGQTPIHHPPVEQLLPHRPPMLFVRRVLAYDEHGVVAEAVLPEDCPLANGGAVPAIAAVEGAAQAAAAGEAMRQHDDERALLGERMGYLVSLRDIRFGQAQLPVGRPFVVVARLVSRVLPLSTYAVEAFVEGRLVLSGEIGTFLANGA